MNHWNNLTEEQVLERLASLSMITLSEKEKPLILEKLKVLLPFIDELNKVDTTDIEPLFSLTENYNTFREDEPGSVLDHDRALKEVQNNLKNDNYFMVPKNK